MEFHFRRAEEKDLPAIMNLITGAKARVPDPAWFEMEDLDFIKRHITEEGFTILAEYASQIAGIMVVRIPGMQEDNLGAYLNLTIEEMQRVAHLEIAVVSPEFQGNQLQYRLFCMAEQMLRGQVPEQFLNPNMLRWQEYGNYKYLMATVHPENRFSLHNMEKLGMEVVADVIKYGGKRRYVMWKQL